jgi:hypothetical protein
MRTCSSSSFLEITPAGGPWLWAWAWRHRENRTGRYLGVIGFAFVVSAHHPTGCVELAERVASVEQERDRLSASHERLRLELELLKRRLFVAKAEPVGTTQSRWTSPKAATRASTTSRTSSRGRMCRDHALSLVDGA